MSIYLRTEKGRSLKDISDDLISSVVSEAVKSCNGAKKGAERMIQVSRNAIHRYLKKAGGKQES
ncbi:MAG: hypothetical protein AB7V04_05550, partial [Desulfomonilaceae bacterium]